MRGKQVLRFIFILFGLTLIFLNFSSGFDSTRDWLNLGIGVFIVVLGLIDPINVFKHNKSKQS